VNNEQRIHQASSGTFVAERIQAGLRHNLAGIWEVYIETAKAVPAEYPELSTNSKSSVLGSIKHSIELYEASTRELLPNKVAVLGALSRRFK
jgi:hypothetical protein